MENGFARMDDEVNRRSQSNQTFTYRCELQTPHCNAARSTVVIVVAMLDKLVVSNYGDSRAVLYEKT
ncbi:Protein phosphatase 2C 3 [Glycine max]|nr:Protein phosphatase 2C 3 [Glycine max]